LALIHLSAIFTLKTYQHTEKDLEYNEPDSSPVIRAAENPSPAVLEAMLAYYEARKNDKSFSDVEQCLA
jgi:mannose/cellobiose epimerase-like protein (N-acyl-D-glucosamine 2-epimerase family)